MLVYCCADLIFATKIGSTAQVMNLPARPARDAAALQRRLDRVDDGKLNEPVRAVFLDMELGDAALAMLQQVKEHSPHVPVVCFGSHVAVELLQAARDAGATAVLARSAFTATLPSLIRQLAGPPAQGTADANPA
jgi:DNA-binding NtrC family response regulator